MQKLGPSFLVAVFLGACGAQQPRPSFDAADHVEAVTEVVRSYESSLNESDVSGIIALYASDAVFMPPHQEAIVGQERIAAAYHHVLGSIRLELVFEIDEVVVVSPTMAFARTRSSGTKTIVATEQEIHEENREIFVIVRDAGGPWRIGRYIFASTQPAG